MSLRNIRIGRRLIKKFSGLGEAFSVTLRTPERGKLMKIEIK